MDSHRFNPYDCIKKIFTIGQKSGGCEFEFSMCFCVDIIPLIVRWIRPLLHNYECSFDEQN